MEIVEQLGDKGELGESSRERGDLYHDTDQYEKAIECYREALEFYEKLGDKKKVVRIYINMGAAYYNTRQFEKAIESYGKALEFDEELGDKEEVGRTYRKMGDSYHKTNQHEKAIECYRKAFEITEEPGDKLEMGDTYQNMGYAYNKNGQYDKAVDCSRKALEIAEELGDKRMVGRIYMNMGYAYNNAGQYDKAIDCFPKALEIAEELGEKGNVGRIYKNMGDSYLNTDQNGKAIDCYGRALKIAIELGDKRKVGRTYSPMGAAYNNNAQYDKAIECYHKALEICEELGGKGDLGLNFRNLGNAYNNTRQFDKAIDCYRKALELPEELGDKGEMGKIYSNMGYAYDKSDQCDKAIDCYLKALEIAKELGDQGKVERIYINMGALYNNIGQYKKATDCHRKALEIVKILREKQQMEYNVTAKQTKIEATINSAIISEDEPEDKLEDDNKAAVAETLQHGGKKNNRISLLFIGQDGVGKTSLKKNLLGEKAKKYEASTIGIEYEVVEVKENNKSKPWKRAADSQFMASKEYADDIIAKETAKRKYESQKSLEEAKDGSRRHDEDGRKSDTFGDGGKGSDESGRGHEDGSGGSHLDAGGSHQDEGEKNVEEERKTQESMKRQIEYQLSDKQIEEAMKYVENYNDDTMDTIRFLVGDVGGQSVFYDVHSMMLRLRTLFTLVVDLTKSPNDVAKPKFVGKEKREILGNPMQETNLDYLTKWAAALRNLNSCDNDAKPKNAVASPDQPKLVVVYTKADNLSDEEVETKKEEIRKAVWKRLERVGCESLFVKEFFISNMKPSIKDLEDLRATIFEAAQDLLKKQEKTPVNWLVLERLLDDEKRKLIMTDSPPYITFDEAKHLGEQCNVVDTTFNDAMKFFHEENIVVHFQDNPLISGLVVLDPAWLVKLFTQVITVSKDSSSSAKLIAWDNLHKTGKLDFDKLPTVLGDDGGSRNVLIEMMVKACLICPWRENIYLVPSMVKKEMKEYKICNLLSKSLKPSLFLDFEDGSIPLGFYTRFQVELLKRADSPLESEELQLYCNFMRVAKTVNGSDFSVILVRHISRIEFAILDLTPKEAVPKMLHHDGQDDDGETPSKKRRLGEETEKDQALIPDGNLAKELPTDIAKKVLSDLHGIIKDIQSNQPNFKGMRYEFGLKCDLCREETDDPCPRHGKEACNNGDCVHFLSLDELKKPLPFCSKNQAGTDTSKLHKTSWVKATVKIDESELHEDTDNTDIGAPKRKKTTPVPQVGQQSVSDLNSSVRLEICKKLNLKNVLKNDYRGLAAHFEIYYQDILTISQSSDPTDNVLVRIGHNPKNTIAQLREKLKTMGRDDCVNIIDSEANEHDIKPGKNDAQAVHEEEPGANAQFNNSTQKNYVRETIPLTVPKELTDILISINEIEGFGVVDEKLMINVFEDREDAARESIKKTLETFPAFTSDKWYIETWTETNCMKLHSNSAVGGFELRWPLKKGYKSVGTIGCLFQSLDGKIYGVTCDHVVDGLDNSSDQFSITVNKVTRTFPKENVLRMLKPEEAVDIALLPLNESCDAFDFEHDECDVYSGEISELMRLSVQKNGAITTLTKGEIISVDYVWKVRENKMPEIVYQHLILVASSSDAEFSKEGDSGSIVTHCRGVDETTHKAVSMVLGGGFEMNNDGGQLKHASVALPLRKAMDLLPQKEENIGNGYVILSKLESKTLDKSKEN